MLCCYLEFSSHDSARASYYSQDSTLSVVLVELTHLDQPLIPEDSPDTRPSSHSLVHTPRPRVTHPQLVPAIHPPQDSLVAIPLSPEATHLWEEALPTPAQVSASEESLSSSHYWEFLPTRLLVRLTRMIIGLKAVDLCTCEVSASHLS